MLKIGSKWSSADGKIFVILGTIVLENKKWVHYRLLNSISHMPESFSCYEESFLSRFRPLPE